MDPPIMPSLTVAIPTFNGSRHLSQALRSILEQDGAVFELHALDVLHSFWVPEFGQKQDAVPGEVTEVAITPTKVGEYPIICTELCGLGHALMRDRVRGVRHAEYQSWLAEQRQAGSGGEEAGG